MPPLLAGGGVIPGAPLVCAWGSTGGKREGETPSPPGPPARRLKGAAPRRQECRHSWQEGASFLAPLFLFALGVRLAGSVKGGLRPPLTPPARCLKGAAPVGKGVAPRRQECRHSCREGRRSSASGMPPLLAGGAAFLPPSFRALRGLEARRLDVPALCIGGKAGPFASLPPCGEDELREGETAGPPDNF